MKVPAFRKLRGYAFDPSLSLKLDTAAINQIVYKVCWEELKPPEGGAGPVGEYVEVIDFDPTVKKMYAPVDLNDPYVLAMDGHDPSEGNPQFHQQMVYAVAMTTIKNFEWALGRKIQWAPRKLSTPGKREEYVPRLRIYPHALRDANAYYSPPKKALLFGYFSATPANNTLHMPGGLVFTCLSHDIIAHETTHAILDGMFPYFNEATNPDVLAFHEAFADIVALFQHFTFPEVLRHQIGKTRGELSSENLLGQLAQEVGSAIGCYGSLRDAIGAKDEGGTWRPTDPNPAAYANVLEPHARGSILVSAIFEAFTSIFRNRSSDLRRIASNGTGVLALGELQQDLVHRLAAEASKSAQHVLHMCIRALDYCPPVDITFGDYLRAIITADAELVADDERDYRLAFVDAFRRRGIYPTGIKTLSVDSLRYPSHPVTQRQEVLTIVSEFLRDFRADISYVTDRAELYRIARDYITGRHEPGRKDILGLHERLAYKFEDPEFEQISGLVFQLPHEHLGIRTASDVNGPSFQIQNLRCVSRVGPHGTQINQIIFALVQRCGVVLDRGQETLSHYVPGVDSVPDGGFQLRGGCTMIFDLDTLKLKYAISKPLLAGDDRRIDWRRASDQAQYQRVDGPLHLSDYQRYFGLGLSNVLNEPFMLLHQQTEGPGHG